VTAAVSCKTDSVSLLFTARLQNLNLSHYIPVLCLCKSVGVDPLHVVGCHCIYVPVIHMKLLIVVVQVLL